MILRGLGTILAYSSLPFFAYYISKLLLYIFRNRVFDERKAINNAVLMISIFLVIPVVLILHETLVQRSSVSLMKLIGLLSGMYILNRHHAKMMRRT